MHLHEVVAIIETQVVNGELRQANQDSGDSALRDGQLYAIFKMLGVTLPGYEMAIQGHEVSPGVYRRTSDKSHWGYNADCLSRDNMAGLRLAFAVVGDKKRLRDSWNALKYRGYRHQNVHRGTDCSGDDCAVKPDFVHPNELGVTIRGLSQWYLYPLLYITDLFYLGDLALRKTADDYDQLLLPPLAYAQLKYPTLVSRLAWYLYDKDSALKKIERYFEVSEDKNGIRGMSELFKLLVEKLK